MKIVVRVLNERTNEFETISVFRGNRNTAKQFDDICQGMTKVNDNYYVRKKNGKDVEIVRRIFEHEDDYDQY